MIHYYRTRTGRKVDFLVPRRGRPPMLVQACESLADPRTRKRETAALAAAMGELDVGTATIVTRNERERIEIEAIEVVPAWRFLLDTDPAGD